jgi:hypothetical protein
MIGLTERIENTTKLVWLTTYQTRFISKLFDSQTLCLSLSRSIERLSLASPQSRAAQQTKNRRQSLSVATTGGSGGIFVGKPA